MPADAARAARFRAFSRRGGHAGTPWFEVDDGEASLGFVLTVTRPEPDDRPAWEALFRAYIDFYERNEPQATYDRAWEEFARDDRLHALVAKLDLEAICERCKAALQRRRVARVGQIGAEGAFAQHGAFPDLRRRFCTSDHKTAKIGAAISPLLRDLHRQLGRQVRVLDVLGIRAEEYTGRAANSGQ